MTVSFIKKTNGWRCCYKKDDKKFTVYYGINSYGKYAKSLAEMSEKTGKRYNNYIIENGDVAIIKIAHRGIIYDIMIDIEDIKKVENYKLRIVTYTCNNKTYLYTRAVDRRVDGKYKYKQLTRIITNNDKCELIYFKNKDRFDYRKENLIIYAPCRISEKRVDVLNE